MTEDKFMKNDSHYLSYDYFLHVGVFLLILTIVFDIVFDTFIYKFCNYPLMYIKCIIHTKFMD